MIFIEGEEDWTDEEFLSFVGDIKETLISHLGLSKEYILSYFDNQDNYIKNKVKINTN